MDTNLCLGWEGVNLERRETHVALFVKEHPGVDVAWCEDGANYDPKGKCSTSWNVHLQWLYRRIRENRRKLSDARANRNDAEMALKHRVGGNMMNVAALILAGLPEDLVGDVLLFAGRNLC